MVIFFYEFDEIECPFINESFNFYKFINPITVNRNIFVLWSFKVNVFGVDRRPSVLLLIHVSTVFNLFRPVLNQDTFKNVHNTTTFNMEKCQFVQINISST